MVGGDEDLLKIETGDLEDVTYSVILRGCPEEEVKVTAHKDTT